MLKRHITIVAHRLQTDSGKIETSETSEQTLIHEIEEELDTVIAIDRF